MNRLHSVLWMCLILSASPVAAQVTLVVDDDGQGTVADCNASTPTYTTVAAAMAAAANGDNVFVCPGTYVETINFSGKAITVRSAAGPGATILDGNATGNVVTFTSGETATSVLEGFTIRNGFGGSYSSWFGGGIYIGSASPIIRGNVIVGNRGCEGVGIAILFASPLVEENTIAQNVQSGCIGGTGGGGILIQGSGAAVIRRNVIRDNVTGSDGGGISLFAAGAPIIEFNIISGNSAYGGGGISLANQSDANITGNVIVRNDATEAGGGIKWLVPAGTRGPNLVNNTIAENESASGAGIFADGFDVSTTLFNNLITAAAGQTAVYCGDFNDPNAPVFRSNNVFSASGPAYGGICSDQTGRNGNISANPLFADPAAGDLHLLSGSPCIDSGDDTAPGLSATDIDNHARVLDGNADGLEVVDIGADEAVAGGPPESLPGVFARTSPADGVEAQPTVLPIRWEASSGATGYEYCYDTVDNGTCDGSWLPAWGSTFAALFGLEGQTAHYWQVRAHNAAGTTYASGGSSTYWTFTTELTPPVPFGKSRPLNNAVYQPTNLTLTWEVSRLATGYEYCYDTVDNGVCDESWVSAGSSTSALVTGLSAYTLYYWQVRAINPAGSTPADGGGYWSFRTGMAMPLPFAKSSPANGAQAQRADLTLSWQASAGATSYQYCYDSTDNGACDWGWIAVGVSTAATVTGLSADTTYYWQVRAWSAGGTTDANAGTWWSFTTQRATPRSDVDGDGRSDVVWRHTTRGEVWLWPMDGAARVSETHVRTIADTNWEIRGQGDQTGDGRADLLWRNRVTGEIYFWPMDGSTPLDEIYVGTVDPAYDILGTGDFDGDGKADILWRHMTRGDVWIWLMDGATPLDQVYVDRVPLRYQVRGIGDVDADSNADIVWRSATRGEVWLWRMNGTTRLEVVWLATVPDLGYDIQAVDDFNGDGKADLLWWHSTRGEVWIWTMDGTTRPPETWVATVPETEYRIVGTGDYNGDGKADILWHHATRGEVWVWLMDGTTKVSETWVATVPDVGYRVAAGAGPDIVTITFDGLAGSGAPAPPYDEQGFTMTPDSADWLDWGYGAPGPALVFQVAAGATATREVHVAAGGSTFSFLAVDLYSSTTPIPYEIIGTRSASTVFSLVGTMPNTYGNYVTLPHPTGQNVIDALVIRLTNPAAPCCPNPVGLDNIVLRR